MKAHEHWLPTVRAIADRAGQAILEVYAQDFSASTKADRTPITAADLAAHALIVEALSALTPMLPVISEESAQLCRPSDLDLGCYWLVDPLDGTREFIKRNDEFCVLIALMDQQRPVLSVVHGPVSGRQAFAIRGRGVYEAAGPTAVPRPIVSSIEPQAQIRVLGSRSHRDPSETAMLESYRWPKAEQPLGSALKFVEIAAGRADLYLRGGRTNAWDTAAGQLLVEEAGGRVLDWHGVDISYRGRDQWLNPPFVVEAPWLDTTRTAGV